MHVNKYNFMESVNDRPLKVDTYLLVVSEFWLFHFWVFLISHNSFHRDFI